MRVTSAWARVAKKEQGKNATPTFYDSLRRRCFRTTFLVANLLAPKHLSDAPDLMTIRV